MKLIQTRPAPSNDAAKINTPAPVDLVQVARTKRGDAAAALTAAEGQLVELEAARENLATLDEAVIDEAMRKVDVARQKITIATRLLAAADETLVQAQADAKRARIEALYDEACRAQVEVRELVQREYPALTEMADRLNAAIDAADTLIKQANDAGSTRGKLLFVEQAAFDRLETHERIVTTDIIEVWVFADGAGDAANQTAVRQHGDIWIDPTPMGSARWAGEVPGREVVRARFKRETYVPGLRGEIGPRVPRLKAMLDTSVRQDARPETRETRIKQPPVMATYRGDAA